MSKLWFPIKRAFSPEKIRSLAKVFFATHLPSPSASLRGRCAVAGSAREDHTLATAASAVGENEFLRALSKISACPVAVLAY
jgi:hypothetical protein